MRVPSCNTSANYKQCPHAFKLSTVHVLTVYEVFSCGLLTSNNMISLASWCNKHFFKGNKFHFPCGLVQKHHRESRQWYPHQKLGLLAKFVEHCTGIVEVMSSNPLQTWISCSSGLIYHCLSSIHYCKDHFHIHLYFCCNFQASPVN